MHFPYTHNQRMQHPLRDQINLKTTPIEKEAANNYTHIFNILQQDERQGL